MPNLAEMDWRLLLVVCLCYVHDNASSKSLTPQQLQEIMKSGDEKRHTMPTAISYQDRDAVNMMPELLNQDQPWNDDNTRDGLSTQQMLLDVIEHRVIDEHRNAVSLTDLRDPMSHPIRHQLEDLGNMATDHLGVREMMLQVIEPRVNDHPYLLPLPNQQFQRPNLDLQIHQQLQNLASRDDFNMEEMMHNLESAFPNSRHYEEHSVSHDDSIWIHATHMDIPVIGAGSRSFEHQRISVSPKVAHTSTGGCGAGWTSDGSLCCETCTRLHPLVEGEEVHSLTLGTCRTSSSRCGMDCLNHSVKTSTLECSGQPIVTSSDYRKCFRGNIIKREYTYPSHCKCVPSSKWSLYRWWMSLLN